jgi:hypothetical protein
MSESKQRNFAIALSAVTVAVVTANTWINSKTRKIIQNSSPVTPLTSVPASVSWIGQSSFDVLTAICDAFIPVINPSELTLSRLHEALRGIHKELHTLASVENEDCMNDHRLYLCRGAVALGIPEASAKALDILISRAEQLELSLMLKILSTSVGCYCTAGYPLPFQVLSVYFS